MLRVEKTNPETCPELFLVFDSADGKWKRYVLGEADSCFQVDYAAMGGRQRLVIPKDGSAVQLWYRCKGGDWQELAEALVRFELLTDSWRPVDLPKLGARLEQDRIVFETTLWGRAVALAEFHLPTREWTWRLPAQLAGALPPRCLWQIKLPQATRQLEEAGKARWRWGPVHIDCRRTRLMPEVSSRGSHELALSFAQAAGADLVVDPVLEVEEEPSSITIGTDDFGEGAGWRMVLKSTGGNLPGEVYIGAAPKSHTSDLVPQTATGVYRVFWQPVIVDQNGSTRYMKFGTDLASLEINLPTVVQILSTGKYNLINSLSYQMRTTFHPSGKAYFRLVDSPAATVKGGMFFDFGISSVFGSASYDASDRRCQVGDTRAGGQDNLTVIYGGGRYGYDSGAAGSNGDARYARLQKTGGSFPPGDYLEHGMMLWMLDASGEEQAKDYRNPDRLDGAENAGRVIVGELVTDDLYDDDNDGFNESTGWYTFACVNNCLLFVLDPRRGGSQPVTFYQPSFKVTNWQGFVPERIWVGGAARQLGLDFAASLDGEVLYLQLFDCLSGRSAIRIGEPPSEVSMTDLTAFMQTADITAWLDLTDLT